MLRWKTLQIHPVVNAVNSGIGTALAEQIAAVIRFDCNELRGGADFPQQVIIAKILHEILAVRGDAEWNS
jgi:hypothetical protein